MAGSSSEFPLLQAMNLKAVEIRGDGNCLFNALSDQIYGHQEDHHKIRARVIDYMRENAALYKPFLDVQPGGGQRRNPKRKNAGTYSSATSFTPPTQEEIDRVFESHLQSMARGGTYGDNLEISAFTNAFGVDVMIYQHDLAYMVRGQADGTVRPVAHIAYHTWEHYSSVRNIDGPDTGLPRVAPRPLSPEEAAKNQEKAAKATYVQEWMIKNVISSLPYLAGREVIIKTLQECKGNIDAAVSQLLDAEDRSSLSSQHGSSSSNERDPDSDDEDFSVPNKKQDRRMSKATKVLREKAEKDRREASSLATALMPIPTMPASPSIELPVRPLKQPRPRILQPVKPFVLSRSQEEEDWTTPSEDDLDGDFRPELREVDDDATSEFSSTSRSQSRDAGRSQSRDAERTGKVYIKFTAQPTKTFQRQVAPKPNRITARDRIDQKKLAQKAARKESKKAASLGSRQLDATSIDISKAGVTPNLGIGIKTLYI